VLFPCRASRGFACRFAEKVARDVDYRKPSPLFRMCLKICFDEDLHGFLACVHFDTDRRIAEIDLMGRPFFPRIIACAMSLLPLLEQPLSKAPHNLPPALRALSARALSAIELPPQDSNLPPGPCSHRVRAFHVASVVDSPRESPKECIPVVA
jgi:hypothetical protein